MRRMVKRESERMIYQLTFVVPIIVAFLGLEAFDREAPGPLPPATVGQQTTTVSGSRPAKGNFKFAPTKVDNVGACVMRQSNNPDENKGSWHRKHRV